MSWHVYVVRCNDKSLYTGITTDLNRRVAEHNAGTGSKYCRSRLPVTLAYSEPSENRSTASKREAELKSWTKSAKEILIREHNEQSTRIHY